MYPLPAGKYNRRKPSKGNKVMGNKVYKARKATFTVEKVKGNKGGEQRLFHPVNKRAKTVARKLGKRTNITLAELRSSVGNGTYKFYAYGTDGMLKAIRF